MTAMLAQPLPSQPTDDASADPYWHLRKLLAEVAKVEEAAKEARAARDTELRRLVEEGHRVPDIHRGSGETISRSMIRLVVGPLGG